MLFERINLEPDENVIIIVRKHWWILVRQIISSVVLAVAPIVLYMVLVVYLSDIAGAAPLREILITYSLELQFVYLAWLLVVWMMFANFWTDHYLDLWAITDRRIIAIDQRGFFRRFLSSFRLERLQDMNIEVNGILPTLLNYGSIEAQTAGGSNEEFKAFNMPDPRGLKALIIKSADERQRIVYKQRAILDEPPL